MPADAYEAYYREFDSPLMRRIRAEAYGEDIGQHSWVTADELRADIARLALTPTSHLVDLGCGPAGPLTFLLAAAGCSATGIDASNAALQAGRLRAETLGVSERLVLRDADLDAGLPLATDSCDAAMTLDVVLHLRDRASFYREVARVLRPGGRFLITDAGVLTGIVAADELIRRSPHMHTTFVPPGLTERQLEDAGFTIAEVEDRTASTVTNATGRLRAIGAHRAQLVAALTSDAVDAQEAYLTTVIELAERRALSRIAFLAIRR